MITVIFEENYLALRQCLIFSKVSCFIHFNSFSAASIEQYLNGLEKITEFPSSAGLQYQLVRL